MTDSHNTGEYEFTNCAEPGCENKIKSYSWGRIKADDWFFQKDGTSWCPEHIPEWVEQWRQNNGHQSKRPPTR